MFTKPIRGSLFIVLMLIVSTTLAGCSANIGDLFGKITGFLGNFGEKLGGWITKGVDIAKGVVDKVKDFAQPLIEKGTEIFEKFKPIGEKLTNGFGDVSKIFDKAGDIGNKITDFGKNFASQSKDALGNLIQKTTKVNDLIASPDSEDGNGILGINPSKVKNKINSVKDFIKDMKKPIDLAKDSIKNIKDAAKNGIDFAKDRFNNLKDATKDGIDLAKDGLKNLKDVNKKGLDIAKDGLSSGAQAAKELLTVEEVKEQASKIVNGTKKIQSGVSDLEKRIKDMNIPGIQKNDLLKEINIVKNNMARIAKDPTSDDAKAIFEASKDDINDIINASKKYTDLAKGGVDSIKSITEGVEKTIDGVGEKLEELKNTKLQDNVKEAWDKVKSGDFKDAGKAGEKAVDKVKDFIDNNEKVIDKTKESVEKTVEDGKKVFNSIKSLL